MLKFPRWRVDVTVGDDLVKTFYETATTSKAAIAKAKNKMRGAVSSAGAFKFKGTRVKEDEDHATKRSTKDPRTPVKAYVRTYTDSGQTKAYVEWSDGSRTEGEPGDAFMEELFRRARREGVRVRHEVW